MLQPVSKPTTAAAALLSLFLVLYLTAASARAAEDAGQVHVVVGGALRVNAAGQETPVQKGMAVAEGDRIVTADQALVQIKLRDGTYLSVRSGTDVTIANFRWDEKAVDSAGMLLRLTKGALRSITGALARGRPSAYSVVTPTATIGIRGTDHEPVFIPEPKPGEMPIGTPGTYDKVNSGATFINTAAGRVDVLPGQVGFVPAVPRVPPTILPRTPDFFKKLDVREERRPGSDREMERQGRPEAGEGRRGDGDGRGGEGRRGDGDGRAGEGRPGRQGQGQGATGSMPQGGSPQGSAQSGQIQPGAASMGGIPGGPAQPPGMTQGPAQSGPMQAGAPSQGAMQASPLQPAGAQPLATNPGISSPGAVPSAPAQHMQPLQPVPQIQPLQPVPQIQPVQAIQPMQPVQTIQPMQTGQPIQQIQPSQPIQPIAPQSVTPMTTLAPTPTMTAPTPSPVTTMSPPSSTPTTTLPVR